MRRISMPGRVALIAAVSAITCSNISIRGQKADAPVNLLLSTVPPAQETRRYPGYAQPKYKEAIRRSLYLTMRDGVRIAIDVVLPKGLPEGERIPTIMNMTRYRRSYQGDKPAVFFISFGYAQVFVDARGTGASFGIWRAPFSQDEIKDYGEVVNWIVAQPWSNGKVGALGNSYEGNTALWLTVSMNPAVKAVIPRHFEFDEYAETPYPGGVLTDWLIKTWNDANRQLDTTPGVKLVDDDSDQSLYRQATAHRKENMDVYAAALQTVFRDDRTFGVSLDGLSLHTYRRQIEKSQAAINSWGGWFDASTADATIKSFLTLSNYQRAVVGPWNHGGGQNADPYQTANPERVMQGFELLRFFDHYLKGVDSGLDAEKRFYYFTMGAEKWKVTNTWPVAGTRMTRWYLDGGNTLSTSAPRNSGGEDRYQVNFEATTGMKNRWHTQVGGQVEYAHRAEEDKKLLTYTSQPLTSDTEVTGYPIIDLFITSTATDGAFFVYLEDVDENGGVTYLTEGQLRALHRRISTAPSPLKILVPYHSFLKGDAMPLVPGQLAELKFGLQPTSVLIRKGHRFRIAIAGADKDTFARIPAQGNPSIAVMRNQRNSSWIELPVISQ